MGLCVEVHRKPGLSTKHSIEWGVFGRSMHSGVVSGVVDGEAQEGVFFYREQLKIDTSIAFNPLIVLSPAKKKTSAVVDPGI